jgi:hypothetical protein
MDKPTVKQIEEYMASLNLPEAGFNRTTSKDLYDVVSKPKHYMLFNEETVVFFADNNKGIEVRDVITQLVDKFDPAFEGMFIADYVQLMQYLMRFMDKNGVEDLKKARWYLDKMIEAY